MSTGVLVWASALAFTPQAFAQQEEVESQDPVIEEIITTGSRIKRAGVDTFYPAISVNTEELEDGAFFNIADALNQIPSFGNPDATPFGAQNSFSVGANYVDFLGLGAQRTLTLVDGRRFVSSNTPQIFGENGGLQVDFNVIPLALVDRIETIGVGGAPIYGSDAIAGTVNVILKDRFEGVQLNLGTGGTTDSDADYKSFSLVAGANFSDGRGNVTLSMETFRQNGLLRNDRPRYTANDPYYASEEDHDDDPDTPPVRRIYYDQRVQLFSEGGSISGPIGLFIPSFGAGGPYGDLDGTFYQFDSNSDLFEFRPGQACPGSAFFACRGMDPNGPDHDGPDFFDNVAQIQSPLDREVFMTRVNYDVTDSITFEADVIFANTQATELVNQGGFQTFAFTGTSGALTFPVSHVFVNDQAREIMTDAGLTSFVLHRFNNDIIDSANKREQFLWHATAGIDGGFDVGERNFFWSVNAGHGESDAETNNEGIVDGRFLNALDAIRLTADDFVDEDGTTITEDDILAFSGTASAGIGDIVCRSTVDAAFGRIEGVSGFGVTDEDLPFVTGCVPLNLFGLGARSEAARDWVTANQMTQSDIEQSVFNVNFGGDIFELPGGWVAFNVGYETREEVAVFAPGSGTEVPITRSAPFVTTGGEYETDEYYGEIVLPLVSANNGIPFMEFAELNYAFRSIDNSLAGEQDVWTAGIRFAPVRDISFRANMTESIRAPSLVELFAPQNKVFGTADDPCDNRFVNEGPVPATRRANCASELGPDYDPDTFVSNIVNATAIGKTGGNPNLLNESAESYSYGLTFEPRWVENLLFTADYVSIEITDAIQSLTLTQLMKSCYDSSGFPDSDSCGAWVRDSEFQVIDFTTGQANAALFDYEQLEFGLEYAFDVSSFFGMMKDSWGDGYLGEFETRWRLNHPLERRISVVGEPNANTLGGYTDPEWSGSFDFIWTNNNARVFWRLLWQDEALLDPEGEDIFLDAGGNEIQKTDARFISNATFAYNFEGLFKGAPANTTIQLGIGNVFNRKPDLIQEAIGHFGTAELLGRTYSLTLQGDW
jgi:outer membrane receptor protein involved in Fe transport